MSKDKIAERLFRFESFFDAERECPCCNEKEECLLDCTFEEDDYSAYRHMQQIRELYKEAT